MAGSSRDGSLDLLGRPRGRSQRKPPRHLAVHGRYASEEPQRSSRLTTFQKLDREMGKFLRSQTGLQNGTKDSCNQQISEEDSSRGVRHGVKWKCGWMFEQDSLYWETVRRQNVSGDEEASCLPPQGTLETVKEKGVDGLGSMSISEPGSCEAGGVLPYPCGTDRDSISEVEVDFRKIPARRTSESVDGEWSKGTKLVNDNGRLITCKDEKAVGLEKEDWPAVLKTKYQVLQIEKDLANQRWRQQCAEMAQAAEMAHCLRTSVQTILETAKRGTVSAPCTPGRLTENDNLCLLERIERLQTVNVQRDLEDKAKSFQRRIENLQLKSQVRSGNSSSQKDRELNNPSGSVSSARVRAEEGRNALYKLKVNKVQATAGDLVNKVKTNAEEWAQVQEVLDYLRSETTILQHSCESWEKRAILAESKAASLQLEEEKWRVEAQKSEEKIKELEKELIQVRATMEDVRNRHALEQSRLLGSGSNHSYALVLQPFVRNSSSSICRCSVSSDFQSCMCGGQCHTFAQEKNQASSCSCQRHVTRPTTFDGGETCTADEPNSDSASQSQGTMSTKTPSPLRDFRVTSNQVGIRHRYESSNSRWDRSPSSNPSASKQTDKPAIAITEEERILSQRWFKQRPKTPLPKTLANGSPLPTRVNGGAGRESKGPITPRTSTPLSAGKQRFSSPLLTKQRMPLKEIKRNALPTK